MALVNHYTSNSAAFALLLSPKKKIHEKILGEINGLIASSGMTPTLQIKDHGYNTLFGKIRKADTTSEVLDLRFSSINKLNDTSEFEYGRGLVKRYLKKMRAPSDKIRKWRDFAIEMISSDEIMSVLRGNTYVFSMSILANDLNQWRLYGEDGAGVGLSFDKNKISQLYKTLIYSSYEAVKYSKKEIAIALKAMLTEPFDVPEGFKYSPDIQHLIPNNEEMSKSLLLFKVICTILSLKHEAFAPEKEVRLIYAPIFCNYIENCRRNRSITFQEYLLSFFDDVRQFDIHRNVIYHYKVMPVPMDSVREIWLGPKNPNTVEVYKDYLRFNGCSDITVEKSSLPYK